MTIGDRDGLIGRIRQVRRAAALAEPSGGARTADIEPSLSALETRMAHLEQLLEGLQDSVHRESERVAERLAELERLTQPEAIASALTEDARRRGL